MRQTQININVNEKSAVTSIKKLKDAFVELNKQKEKVAPNGKLKLTIDTGKVDLTTISQLSKAISRLSSSMGKYKNNIDGFAKNGQLFNVTTNQITNNIIKTSEATKKLNTDMLASSMAFEIVRRSFTSLMREYNQLTASTFGVGIASQMNISQINELNASFLRLSGVVPTTAKEMADAVDSLIRTGRSYEDSRKIIEETAKLSSASGDNLKDTAQVVTKVMVSLGISGERVRETLTTMHSTAIQTASDMGYLAEAFKNVAGTASVMVKQSGLSGKELDDYRQRVLDFTMASIGSMANLGLSASQAGTKIKNLFGKMVAGEKSARLLFDTAMKLNNVQINDKMFDFDALSDMTKKDLPLAVQQLSQLYKEGKLGTQVMQKMFTARHFMEISNLLIDIDGRVNDFIDSIAKGISYTNDFYKSMFDVNNQVKQFSNNAKASFGSMGQVIQESTAGFLMLANEVLPKINNSIGSSIGGLSSLTLVLASATTSGVLLGKAFTVLKGMFMAGSGGWIGLAIGGIVALGGAIGKLNYETEKAIADLNISFNNNILITERLRSELTKVENKYKQINDTINAESKTGTLSYEIESSSTLMGLLLNKTKDFKDMLDSIAQTKKIDDSLKPQIDIDAYNKARENVEEQLKGINTLQQDMLKGYQNYLNRYRELAIRDTEQNALLIPNAGEQNEKLIKMYEKREIQAQQFIDQYVEIAKKENDIEKRMNEVMKAGKELGLTEYDIKDIMKYVDVDLLEQKTAKLQKAYEDLKKYNDELNNSFKELQDQLTKNNIAYNKVLANLNSLRLENFEETGFLKIDEKEYSGIEGLFQIFSRSKVEEYASNINFLQENVNLYRDSLKGLERQKELGGLSEEEQKRYEDLQKKYEIANNQLELMTTIKEKGLAVTQNELKEMFDGYKFTTKTKDIMLQILSVKQAIADLRTINPEDEKNIKNLEDTVSELFIKLRTESDKALKKENNTRYQIKYNNYLKESLDIELERLKIGQSIGKQEVLNYQYKLKQLNVDKELAKKEIEVSRNTLMKLGAKEFASISTVSEGQKLIDKFYEQNKGNLVGDAGKQLKDRYEALKQLTSDLAKLEKIDVKLETTPLEKYLELLESIPTVQKDVFSNLQEMSFMHIIPAGGYSAETINVMRKNLEESLNKVYESYKIPSDLGISDAINQELSKIDYLKSIRGNDQAIRDEIKRIQNTFGEDFIDFGSDSQENYIALLDLSENKLKDLTKEQKAFLELKKKELEYQNKIIDKYNSLGSVISKLGGVIQSDALSNLGNIFSDFSSLMKTSNEKKFNFGDLFNFDLDPKDFADNFGKAMENALAGLDLGTSIGSLVGGLTGGGQSSVIAGSLAGLGTSLAGITGWQGMAIQAGASLIGGLFGGKDRTAEAEKFNKEQKKIYDKNTEALNRLAQNMSNLSGGVDSLNSSLISSFSKIPTFDKLNNVTATLTDMYSTMIKTRNFGDVAYQVTKTKSGKKGFLGIGSTPSTTWTETVKLSVDDMLRRYGFQGQIEDMTTQQLREFSQWLDEYDVGDTDNFSVLAQSIEDYAEAIDKMDKNINKFFYDATMEGFAGISSLKQDELRKQIEDFYKNLGFQIDEELSKEIDKLAEQMSVMVTITQDVRSSFVNSWRNTGLDAGKAFVGAMTPYVDALLENISQVFYDVYYSDATEQLEKEFKALSEQLVELKKQGASLDWINVGNALGNSFTNVIETIKRAQLETASFNDVLLQLQKQAFESGLTLSEMFQLGLATGTQKDVFESFKQSLSGTENMSALTSIGDFVGDKIGDALADKLMDNLLSDKVLQFSAQLDKVISGNLSFDSLAQLANEAMSVGLMMETERQRLEAIKSMFSMGEISYETQNQNIEYQTGHSSQNTYIYNITSTIEAGSVIESDDIQSLARTILEDQLEILKVEKGVDIIRNY